MSDNDSEPVNIAEPLEEAVVDAEEEATPRAGEDVAGHAEDGEATMTSIEGDNDAAAAEEGTNTEQPHQGDDEFADISADVAVGSEEAALEGTHADQGAGKQHAPGQGYAADAHADPEPDTQHAHASDDSEQPDHAGEPLAGADAPAGSDDYAAEGDEAAVAAAEAGDEVGAPAALVPASASGSRTGSRPASARPASAKPSSRPPSSESARVAMAAADASDGGERPASRQGDNLPGDEMQALQSRGGSGTSTPARGGSGSATPPAAQQPRQPQTETSSGSGGGSGRPSSARPMSARPSSAVRLPSGGVPPMPPTLPMPEAHVAAAKPVPHTTDADVPAAPQLSEYNHETLREIDVEVNQGPGLPYKMVSVLLDTSQLAPKPYLGGFRNKRTGATYHHAVTQTPRAPKYAGAEPKLERTTQTVKTKPIAGQTVREAATQMERPGVVVDTSGDVEKVPGRYQTSEERLAIVTAATCVLQRYLRGCLGRRRAQYLRERRDERETFLAAEEAKAAAAAEAHRAREIERRLSPRTAADFEILYNELEAWRLQETAKIKAAGLTKQREQEVLQQLLHKETKLLQTIDRLKIDANYNNKDLRVQKTLREMGKPKAFELKNGATVDVHTPYTTRAMELMQLYNGLNLMELSIDERLDVLLHVKWTVKEFDCALTREVVELIDREADMLNRGRSQRMLEGLRKRISSLFLTFVETPEFNPEAARFQIVPMEFEAYLFDKLGTATARAQMMTTAHSKWDH